MKYLNKILLVLLLISIVGVTGYGVYSYYWTRGEFSGSASIELSSFNPEVRIDNSQSYFLGAGGLVEFDCPTTDGSDSATCSASIEISNNDDIDLVVDVLDITGSVYNENGVYGSNLVISTDWNSKTIASGESETLNISVSMDITSDWASDSPVWTNNEINPEYYPPHVSFTASLKLKASQAH